jgi:hypothetical protein
MLEFWYNGQLKNLDYMQVVSKLYVMVLPYINKDYCVMHVCI